MCRDAIPGRRHGSVGGRMNKVLVLVGTKKGAFVFESDTDRRSWSQRGPFCETWPISHVVGDPATGTIYGGGGDAWFGPAVWTSTDLGATWTPSSEGLAYAAGEEPVDRRSVVEGKRVSIRVD